MAYNPVEDYIKKRKLNSERAWILICASMEMLQYSLIHLKNIKDSESAIDTIHQALKALNEVLSMNVLQFKAQ